MSQFITRRLGLTTGPDTKSPAVAGSVVAPGAGDMRAGKIAGGKAAGGTMAARNIAIGIMGTGTVTEAVTGADAALRR